MWIAFAIKRNVKKEQGCANSQGKNTRNRKDSG